MPSIYNIYEIILFLSNACTKGLRFIDHSDLTITIHTQNITLAYQGKIQYKLTDFGQEFIKWIIT
ncbi:hypothetical protein [Aquimarina rhabdastrellae]